MITIEELWDKLLEGKSRNTKCLYSKRLICRQCARPIVNTNKSGYCRKCYLELGIRQNYIRTGKRQAVASIMDEINGGKSIQKLEVKPDWIREYPRGSNGTKTKKSGECEAHKLLKVRAIKWLESIGCIHIKTEKIIGRKRAGKTKYVIYDVLGELEGELIAVECGGVRKNRLNTVVSKVYVWPYGEIMPYLLERGMDVCITCGHQIGN